MDKIKITTDGLEVVNDAGKRVVIRTNHGATSDQYIDLPATGGTISTGGGDTDEKTKVSANDTTANYLESKLVAGSNITLTTNNDGGNETITIASAGGVDTDEKTKVSANDTTAGYLNGKLVAGSGITLTENNNGSNETLTIASTVTNTDMLAKVSSNDTTAGYLNGKLVAGSGITLTEGSDGGNETLTIAASGGGGGGGLTGTRYIYVAADGTPTENGADLVAAYNTAKTMTPTAGSRVRIIAAPGYYTDASGLTMDTDYIDLVSLDGNRSVVFDSLGFTINANDAFVRGIVANTSLNLGGGQTNLVMENCKAGNFSFGSFVTTPGTFIDCEGAKYSFGFGSGSDLSGTYIRCKGGTYSFSNNITGTMIDCEAGTDSFATGNGRAISGTLSRCKAGINSFASAGGASGITGFLVYCIAISGGFGFVSGAGKIRLSIGNLYTEVNQG